MDPRRLAAGGKAIGSARGLESAAGVAVASRLTDGELAVTEIAEALEADGLVRLEGLDLG